MANEEGKANYELPASQVDLEERLKQGNASSRVLATADAEVPRASVPDDEGREFTVEDNELDDYRGVSREYMNYANETDKPMRAEEGPEAEVEDNQYENNPDLGKSEADPVLNRQRELAEKRSSDNEDDDNSGDSSSARQRPAAKKATSSQQQSQSS